MCFDDPSTPGAPRIGARGPAGVHTASGFRPPGIVVYSDVARSRGVRLYNVTGDSCCVDPLIASHSPSSLRLPRAQAHGLSVFARLLLLYSPFPERGRRRGLYLPATSQRPGRCTGFVDCQTPGEQVSYCRDPLKQQWPSKHQPKGTR